MHVDGGLTTSIFTAPLIVGLEPTELPLLRGGHIYMIVNGQLGRVPKTTRYKTVEIISNALAAEVARWPIRLVRPS
ncbi:MAG: hypothetical protein ABI216_12485 [Devosia sp.]